MLARDSIDSCYATILLKFLAHGNINHVHKNVQKRSKTFKPSIHNALRRGTNIAKISLSLFICCVRLASYCGKMCSRHLFSYGGFLFLIFN